MFLRRLTLSKRASCFKMNWKVFSSLKSKSARSVNLEEDFELTVISLLEGFLFMKRSQLGSQHANYCISQKLLPTSTSNEWMKVNET